MTIALILLSVLVGIVSGAVGGAAASWKLAGRDLGDSFAALIGSFFGLVHVVPAILLGLIILYFI
jgi:hypothetical protein